MIPLLIYTRCSIWGNSRMLEPFIAQAHGSFP
ncbi:hypothetical protein T03_9710 [Trichinella britovi]|uniref:Uncharacterized protein n=1 Tax=Trichinella britovi TaxID=45882 RepID=A0A0V0YQ18_TRIBR|nr:hypothetical protein T03_12779 [Trichinella britovi]KRY04202.1 hypothetical protein T03_9710 [Trichinella britovi]